MLFNRSLFELLIILAVLVTLFILYNSYMKNRISMEGFEQQDAFILKTEDAIYDDFYVEVYDELMNSKKRVKEQTELILKTVPIDKESSHLLDIGSGTGQTVRYLTDLGYRIEGIDKSEEMVKKSINHENGICIIKHADVINPMEYDHSIFTHILCSHFTIYEFENKLTLFKNCYFWLKGRGYLIIHLVDRNEFLPILPIEIGQKELDDKQERITKTEIDYDGYTYTSEYDFVEKSTKVCHKENFVDKKTKHVRQNERTLYMEDHKKILQMAVKAGFVIKESIDLAKTSVYLKKQWLFILERTL